MLLKIAVLLCVLGFLATPSIAKEPECTAVDMCGIAGCPEGKECVCHGKHSICMRTKPRGRRQALGWVPQV
ncbi:unnamed protein product, partial [Mesorhabditis spiculigera]